MNEKIVVLILSTRSPDYDEFKRALRGTWLKDLSANDCSYFFYEGGHDRNEVAGDTIRLTVEDGLNGTYNKFLAALALLDKLGTKYRCVYRTNLSSYIDVKRLLKFISEVENLEDLIAGVLGKTYALREKMYLSRYLRRISRLGALGRPIYFVSGSGFFLGKNLIQRLQAIGFIKDAFIDDVMVGYTLDLRRQDITEIGRWDLSDFGYSFYQANQRVNGCAADLFHYRLKTADRTFDSLLMSFLHNEHVRDELVQISEKS